MDNDYLICAGTKVQFATFEEIQEEYGNTVEIIDQIPSKDLAKTIKEIFPKAKPIQITTVNNKNNNKPAPAYILANPQDILKEILNKIDIKYNKFKLDSINSRNSEQLAKMIYNMPEVRFTSHDSGVKDITIFEFLQSTETPLIIYDIFVKNNT